MNLELPKDTLIEVEKVEELRGEVGFIFCGRSYSSNRGIGTGICRQEGESKLVAYRTENGS